MAIRQCPRHHFYDDEKYGTCPVCLLRDTDGGGDDKTIGYLSPTDFVADKTVAYHVLSADVISKPTVGWVVCMKGESPGRDWRLHEGRNDIGAASDAEVSLAEMRPCTARVGSIVYDGKHKTFLLVPGEVALLYLNGGLLSEPAVLKDGDIIGVEDNLLCFQSFCGNYQE